MQAEQVEFLFLHDLSDLYDAEQQLADLLPQLVDEMPGGPVKVAYQEHNRETNEQIVNLERCFDLLGEEPRETTCLAIEGLVEAREDFKLNASPTLQMLYDVSASNKIENFEITAYRGLIEKANLLGRMDIVELLEANLRQEEEMAGKVLGLGRQLMQTAMEGQSLR